MTAQEIFNTMVAHLRKQGCKSIQNGKCVYRGPSGTMCAAGCLIPDKWYDKSIEGHSWSAPELQDVRYKVGEEHTILIEDLQEVHDLHEPREWELWFRAHASRHHLTYTP